MSVEAIAALFGRGRSREQPRSMPLAGARRHEIDTQGARKPKIKYEPASAVRTQRKVEKCEADPRRSRPSCPASVSHVAFQWPSATAQTARFPSTIESVSPKHPFAQTGLHLNNAFLMLVGVIAIAAMTRREWVDVNKIVLALASVLNIAISLGNTVKESATLISDFQDVERIMSLQKIEQEPQDGEDAPKNWPRGQINFLAVDMRYRSELPLVLRGVWFSVKAGEKVAIVGRTGAGKSSLLHALFRMAELAGGQIVIDGVDVAKLKLYDLRKRLCVLPQSTMILEGSIRYNLDPFGEHDDAALHDALRRSHLLEEGQTLDFQIETDGRNISQGQRALLSLARALVQRSKILVLDEASAHVDAVTDAQLQSTIATEFKDCTVLAIAHRLRTIIGYDKVLVMQEGSVAETGSPSELFARGGIFSSMCEASGINANEIEKAM